MFHNQQRTGRALTKKTVTTRSVREFVEDDEGYGTSPTTASPRLDGNVFTFVEPPVSSASVKNVAAEDDWLSLEKDLNRVLNMQPLTGPSVKNTTSLSSSSIKMPARSLVASSGKPFRAVSCQFCSKNGEIRSVVESHILRHPVTRSVICPVLRKYVCEICGATGDNAHTKFYCPQNRCRKTAPMAILLKTTRNNATGKRTHP